jgi:hypothetical protein
MSNAWHARILAAWRRLQSNGVLQRHGMLEAMNFDTAGLAHATATAAATAAAARGLHFCALCTCDAQEVHASHFKRCAACLSGVGLLLQRAPSAGLACAQSSLPRGAQRHGGCR